MEPHSRWTVIRYVLLPLFILVVGGAVLFSTASAHPGYAALVVAILVVAIFVAARRWTRRDSQRGWRFHRAGRDQYRYEELIDGNWSGITISGEMLSGKPRHIFYMPTAEQWNGFPEWARHRRAEIIARMRAQCPEPEYAYKNV